MKMNKRVKVYDTTLREGMQRVGTSYSIGDKIQLAMLLDEIGVAYIEGGFPGGNPKDLAFYKRMRDIKLKNSKLVAFGPTCRPGVSPEKDSFIGAVLEADTEVVSIFGKSSLFHVNEILGCSAEENLRMIKDSVAFMKDNGKEVFFDAEHFFDGYKENNDYALKTIEAAVSSGCDYVILCDTNGGILSKEAETIVGSVLDNIPELAGHIGVHIHNDSGFAVAATLAAVESGADLVQVTLNGWGERCGNADLFSVVPNLQLKMGYQCISDITSLYRQAHKASEIANIKMNEFAPYVGKNAFSHKAGVHIDAVVKNPYSYEHICPEMVGNERRYMLSEVSGKAAVLAKVEKLLPSLGCEKEDAVVIADRLKAMELEGYQFEGADASFEMLVKKLLNKHKEWFVLNNYKVFTVNNDEVGTVTASAIVDVTVDGVQEVTAANGIGPVDALDGALRKALGRFYPCISEMRLVDYKVRVLESKLATASVVRVVIESSDGESTWCTVGVSGDIIQASFLALVDSHEYLLNRKLG